MDAEILALGALAWLLTYLGHSTLFLGGAWAADRLLARAASRSRELVWKAALLAGLVTATLQVALPHEPLLGRVNLRATLAAAARTAREALPDATTAPTPSTPESGSRPAATALEVGRAAADPWSYAGRWLVSRLIAATRRAAHEPGASESSGAAPAGGLAQVAAPASPALASPSAAGPDAPARPSTPGRPRPAAPAVRPELGPEPPPSAALLGRIDGSRLDWRVGAVALWLAGASIGAALLALAWRTLQRRLHGRSEVTDPAVLAVLADLCRRAGLRRRVRLTAANGLSTPVALGWLRAEICVPARSLLELSASEQRTMLAHELAHVVRRDALWLFGARALESIFFLQPLNRLARRRLEEEAELQCDDWAAENADEGLALASCLARVATWIVCEREALPVPGMSARGSRLTARVERLLDPSVRLGERSQHWPLGTGLALAGALVLAAPALAVTGAPAAQPPAESALEECELPEEPESDRAPRPFDASSADPLPADDPPGPCDADEACCDTDAQSGDVEPALADAELEWVDPELGDGNAESSDAGAVRAALDALEVEIDSLTDEMDGLRRVLRDAAPASSILARLDTLEQRMHEIDARRAHAARLCDLLGGAPLDSAGTPHPTRDHAPAGVRPGARL